jgi:hypothetical protein
LHDLENAVGPERSGKSAVALTAKQYEDFWQALRDAFDAPRLERMLRFGLNKRLDEIARPGDLQQVVFAVIQDAEKAGYTMELLNAARSSQPGNARLKAFAQQFGRPTATAETETSGKPGSFPRSSAAGANRLPQSGPPSTSVLTARGNAETEPKEADVDSAGPIPSRVKTAATRLTRDVAKLIEHAHTEFEDIRGVKGSPLDSGTITYRTGYAIVGCRPGAIYQDESGMWWYGCNLVPKYESKDVVATMFREKLPSIQEAAPPSWTLERGENGFKATSPCGAYRLWARADQDKNGLFSAYLRVEVKPWLVS